MIAKKKKKNTQAQSFKTTQLGSIPKSITYIKLLGLSQFYYKVGKRTVPTP